MRESITQYSDLWSGLSSNWASGLEVRLPSICSLAIAVLGWTSSVAAQLCFEGNPTVTFPTSSPEVFGCADLDGDHDADFVVGFPGVMSVYLSPTPGVYGSPSPFLVGRTTLAYGDFDNDGDLDFVTNKPDVSLALLLYSNQGNGTFVAGSVTPLSTYPRALCSVDLDGDGDLDVAMASQPMSVVFNQGNGTFGPEVLLGVDVFDSITSADLDGDGDQDLVAGRSFGGAQIAVFMNTGIGTFLPYTALLPPLSTRSLTCHDYDGDGDLDILTPSHWYSNLGNGVFAAGALHATGPAPTWLITGDYDKNGLVDMAVVNQSLATVTVLLNQGGGTYAHSGDYIVGGLPLRACGGDIDGDGDEDILSLNSTNTVTLLNNRGDGTFDTYPHYTASTSALSHFVSITSADFDADGDVDIAASIWNSSLISVLLNQGDGSFGVFTFYGVGVNPWNLTHADLDGDGDQDLVVTNSSSASVSVLMGLGNGTFAPQVQYAVGVRPVSVSAADVDLDGDIDLVVPNSQAATVSVLINQGSGVFAPQATLTASGYPTGVACADLDGDGDVDFVTANTTVNSLSYFRNQGNGTYAAPSFLVVGNRPSSVIAVDLDGDGNQDLAVTNSFGNSVSVLVNQGAGAFAAHVTYSVPGGPGFIAADDVDADGDIDLVTTNGASTARVLLNQGNATFPTHVEYGAGFDPRSVAIADYDGDGRKDLAVVAYNTDFVTVLLQCPPDPIAYCFGDGSGPACPCASVGIAGRGCPNSAFGSGAQLVASGFSRASNDSLRLTMSSTPNAVGLFIQATSPSSMPFGDGLLCVTGGAVRLGVVFTTGASATLPNLSNPTPLHALGAIPPGGGTYFYQAWYRDTNPTFCTQALFNLTNGLVATWAP